MRLWMRQGQAVMAVMMGIMLIGGLVLWVTTGKFHMMPSHGDKHGKPEAVVAPPQGQGGVPADPRIQAHEPADADPEIGSRPGTDSP